MRLSRFGNNIQTAPVTLNQLLRNKKTYANLIDSSLAILKISLKGVKNFVLFFLFDPNSSVRDQADEMFFGVVIV